MVPGGPNAVADYLLDESLTDAALGGLHGRMPGDVGQDEQDRKPERTAIAHAVGVEDGFEYHDWLARPLLMSGFVALATALISGMSARKRWTRNDQRKASAAAERPLTVPEPRLPPRLLIVGPPIEWPPIIAAVVLSQNRPS